MNDNDVSIILIVAFAIFILIVDVIPYFIFSFLRHKEVIKQFNEWEENYY